MRTKGPGCTAEFDLTNQEEETEAQRHGWLSKVTQHSHPFTKVSKTTGESLEHNLPKSFSQVRLTQLSSTELMRKSLLIKMQPFLQGLDQMRSLL